MEKTPSREHVVRVAFERRVPLTQKSCPQCGRIFWGQATKQYCSVPCRNKAAYWRHPEANRASRLKSYRKKWKQAL